MQYPAPSMAEGKLHLKPEDWQMKLCSCPSAEPAAAPRQGCVSYTAGMLHGRDVLHSRDVLHGGPRACLCPLQVHRALPPSAPSARCPRVPPVPPPGRAQGPAAPGLASHRPGHPAPRRVPGGPVLPGEIPVSSHTRRALPAGRARPKSRLRARA